MVWFDDEQLFESQSVIEYWENFASHAFENTTQSVFSHCVLLKPGGEPIPCTFCFSIRRDIFDMPSVVIGKFFLWYFIRCRELVWLIGLLFSSTSRFRLRVCVG